MGGAEKPAKALPLPTPPGLLGEIWVPLQDPGERSSHGSSGNCLSFSEDSVLVGESLRLHTQEVRGGVAWWVRIWAGLAQAGGGGGTSSSLGNLIEKMGITRTTSNPFTNPVGGLLAPFYR